VKASQPSNYGNGLNLCVETNIEFCLECVAVYIVREDKLTEETDQVSFCTVLYFAFRFLDAYVYYSAEKEGGL
jgi:hypothetical protein